MRRRQHTGKNNNVFCLEWGGCVYYTNKTADEEGNAVIGAYPDPSDVLGAVASADDSSCSLLRECAKHVFSSGPEEKLAEWGNAMLCTGPGRPPDLSLLTNLHLTNRRGVCGYSFKKGDICWNCRTCQTDGTCVQCDQCFRQSDHTGHEVYFHHASPGGCCDCGDLEAWKQTGCCPAHAGPDLLADPFENLPEAMRTPARVVMEEAVRLVVDTALHGVQGFNLVEHHPLLSPTPHTGWSFVRLHNDDIHSFADVNDALVHHGLQQLAANEISKAVDAHGHAQVKRDKPEALRSMLTDLATDRGLLASLVDEAQIKREERSVRLLLWLTELTHRVDGLSRLVATILTAPQPITLAQLGLEHGTRWYTPFMRVHQPKPDDPTLVLSSEDASVRLDVATRLTVLLAADFFVVKKMRTELHAMYLNLLIDGVFKPALAKELTMTYKLLSGLFSRGMGTGEDSVFAFTVQLYTTPSLVRWLSTIVEEDDRDPGLLSIITDALIQAMRSTERWEEGTPLDEAFWEHHLLRHRRYNHIFRELDYCVQTPGTALAMLRKALPGPGPHPLETWMRVLTAAQHADQTTRRVGTHVDFETNLWTISFTFALALWQTSHALIVQAFKASEEGDMDVDDDLDARNEALQNLVRTASSALQKWLDSRAVADDALFRMSDTSTGHRKVDFHVHTGQVSFCVPLHRVLGMAIHEGATHGLQIPLSPPFPQGPIPDMARQRFATAVAEFPLRCMVLAAQVTAGLWRRNGMAVAGQAIHYLSLPFCRMLRDSDLAALQYSILLTGHESILHQMLDRYLLSEWVSDPFTVIHTPFEPRAFVTLAEEALTLLIWLVTETPRPPGAEHQRAVLRRELVHRLAARESTHSELHPDRSSPDLQQLGDPNAFDSMLEELSVSKRGSGGAEATAKFDLKPQAAPEYDRTFWHLTRQEHESAVERMVQKRASLQSRGPWPCVGPLPPVHPDFAPVRLLLYSPSVLSLQRTVLLNACGGKGRPEKRSPDLLVRCIHLLTLQLHALTDALKLEEADTRVFPPSLKPYQLSNARPVRAFIGSLGEACDGAGGPSMLQLLIDINSDIKACSVGPLHEEGLRWILTELSDRHAERIRDGGRLLENFRSGGGSGVDGEDGAKTKAEQAKRAQARALAFLQQQRSKFWEDQMDGDDEADEDKEQSAAVDAVDESSLEVGAPACLYCHERTGGAMGYIGFAQRSTVLAHAISACAANKGLQQRYRCVPKEGKTCCVRAEPELHSPEVARLKRGTLMVVEEKRGRRLRISSPVAGWVSEYTANHIRLAEPLERYCFQQWGRQRLYVTMCGHAVHQDCWDAYYASVLQQLITEDRVDNRFALDVGRREFLCPLCKTLSNVLVPHIPGRFHAPSVPSPLPAASLAQPIVPSLASWLLSDSSAAISMTPSPPPSGSDSSSSTLHAMLTRLVQTDTQQGPPLPETLRASLGRFVDSLGEVWEVSWARLSIEGDASQRGSLARRHLLRDSFVAWSALGYSALVDVVNKQNVALVDGGSNGGAGAGEDTATETFRVSPERGVHLTRLMTAVAQLRLLAESPQELREKVLEPLERVLTGGLVGRPDSTSPRDVALRALPLSLMLEHEIHGVGGSNDGRPWRRMRSLHKDRVASKEEGPLEIWPVFDRPLLAQDLTMLAVAVLSLTRTPEDASKAAAVLCLARLAQALMEPGLDSPPPEPQPSLPMNGVDTPPQPPPTSRDVALAQLASELGVHSVCVAGLEQKVWGRWRPYLRTMLALLKATAWTEGHGAAVDGSDAMDVDGSGGLADNGPVPSLLPRLGLPSAICDVEAAAVVPMFRAWAHQYRTFVDSLPFASAATMGTTTTDPLTPASPQPPPPLMSLATATSIGTSLESSEAPGTPVAAESALAGAASALEYHMTPYLSVVDGSVALPEIKGNRYEVAATASGLPLRLYDLSHMGVSDDARIKLVDLPRHYTELYSMLKEQYWLVSGQPANAKGGAAMDEPALCLVCGTMMNAGPRGRDNDHSESREELAGECTMHVRHCGAGHGVMLLINKGSSIIFRESRAAFYLSVYVDQYGEEDVNLRRGRPLYLSRARNERLNQLYRQHAGATETARIRASADRVIRDSYY